MPRIVAKTLPCRLSEKEVQERSRELTSLMMELDEEAVAEKKRRKDWKTEQDETKSEITELRDQVHTKMARREVRCEERRNDVTKTMETIRLDAREVWPDGMEVVNSRPLTPNELQIELIKDHQRDRDGGLEEEELGDEEGADKAVSGPEDEEDDDGDEGDDQEAAVGAAEDAFEGIEDDEDETTAARKKPQRKSPRSRKRSA